MENNITIHEEPRKGRRRGDHAAKSMRDIDNSHRENWIYFMSEQVRMRKALEAIMTRDIEQIQKALDELKKGE